MELQPLIVLKEAAAGMAIEWFRKMAEERVLDPDAVKRIDAAFKIHGLVCKELDYLNYAPEVDAWQDELLDIAGKLRDVVVEHGCPDDRIEDAITRLQELAGIGGAA